MTRFPNIISTAAERAIKGSLRLLCFLIAALISHSAKAQYVSSLEINNVGEGEPFSKITLAADINLNLQPYTPNPKVKPKTKATIEGERSVINCVVCEVKNNELSIYSTRFKYKSSKKVTILLEVPDSIWNAWNDSIIEIYASSANKVRIEKPLGCDTLLLTANYGSNFVVNTRAEYVKCRINNASDLHIWGSAEKADIYAESASTIRAFSLDAGSLSLNCMRSVKADVKASKALDINVSDYCEIYYKGDFESVTINKDNNSKVKQAPEEGIFDGRLQ